MFKRLICRILIFYTKYSIIKNNVFFHYIFVSQIKSKIRSKRFSTYGKKLFQVNENLVVFFFIKLIKSYLSR